MAFNFGGKKLYIPTRDKTLLPIRNKIIKEKHKILMENGDSYNKACKELAEEYGITDKQIYNIVSGRMR